MRKPGGGLLSLGQGLQGIAQRLGPALERGRADSAVRGIDADAIGTDIQQNGFQVGDDFVVLGLS